MAKIERHPTNGWFPAKAFLQVMQVMHNAATQVHTHWLNVPGTKYVTVRVDQRTGDFNILDRDGKALTIEQIQVLFPELEL